MTFQAEARIKMYLDKYTTGRSYQDYWVTNTAGADIDMYNSVQKFAFRYSQTFVHVRKCYLESPKFNFESIYNAHIMFILYSFNA